MKCYVFKGGGLFGFSTRVRGITDDKTGKKLPRRKLGGWAYDKEVEINPSSGQVLGVNADVILAAIAKDGYLWLYLKD
jgi:hypothetical protein